MGLMECRVDKATSEENTSEDWALIMEICDRTTAETGGTKECLRSIVRRLNSPIPGVVMQALTVSHLTISHSDRPLFAVGRCSCQQLWQKVPPGSVLAGL